MSRLTGTGIESVHLHRGNSGGGIADLTHANSIHVDLPGEHGNTINIPILHVATPDVHVDQHFGQTAHVDLPGEHGNLSPLPLVHRGIDHSTHSHGSTGSAGTHVDLPGEHGNLSPLPVVHRGQTTDGFASPFPNIHHGPSGHGGGIHVDLPGQHGNLSPGPVVHRNSGIQDGFVSPRPDLHNSISGHSGGIHVDLPGEHGNLSPLPVVHRDRHGSEIHVDLPGQHGNAFPHPVVHRDSAAGVGLVGSHSHDRQTGVPDLASFPGTPLPRFPPSLGPPIPLFDVPIGPGGFGIHPRPFPGPLFRRPMPLFLGPRRRMFGRPFFRRRRRMMGPLMGGPRRPIASSGLLSNAIRGVLGSLFL